MIAKLTWIACIVFISQIRGVAVAWSAFRPREKLKSKLETAARILAPIGMYLPALWVCTPWLRWADYQSDWIATLFGAANCLFGLGVWGRAHSDLGVEWTAHIDTSDGRELVTGGIYAVVRHPIYLGVFLYSGGLALLIPNYVAGLALLVVNLAVLPARMRVEERLLESRPGWREYRARTAKLLPGWW